MRAHVLAAAALAALTACDTSQDVLRFNVDRDFYEAPSLGTLERAFRREAPFYIDMPDASVLSDEARARLDLQAAWMADHPSTRFYVVAVTRPTKGDVVSEDPAHARARTVEAYLAAAGIDPARLRVRVVPAGIGHAPYDPFLRVTTMLEEAPATQGEVMAAVARDAVPAAGNSETFGTQGAGDVGDPVGANGGPSVPVGGTDGPAAGRPSAPTAGGTPGTAPSAAPSTASGTTSQGPVGGGSTAQGPETGGSSGPGAAPSQPSGPTSAGPSDPGATNPGPGNSGKNAAKRDANSGRGNGDEAGDPGNSGGRNQGGDEIG
jgi:hypothetical protein